MDKLPKDIIEKITNEVSPKELINFCKNSTVL